MKTQIAVVVSAYNEEKLIGKCLKALQNQTFPKQNYEILVVDNNSTDKTAKIAQEAGVKVLTYKEKNIVAAVRNYGAAHVDSPIIAFMDGDSVAEPDWLQSIHDLMQNKKIVAVTGVALPMNGKLLLKFLFESYNQLLRLSQLTGTVLPWGFNLAIKKTAFDQIQGYNTNFPSYEDAEIGIRLQKKFGKKSIIYSQKLKVHTSTRKHQNPKNFYLYFTDNLKNYINVVLLKKTTVRQIRYVR